MPGYDSFTFFRFRVPLPLSVHFRTVSFEVHLQSRGGGAQAHGVLAKQLGTASYVAIGPDYLDAHRRDLAAFHVGLRVRDVTIGETIMRRLVREGRAEIMPVPADDLVARPPLVSARLG